MFIVQQTKILLVPQKCETIMLLFNYSVFQYCDSNIGLFHIAPCKVVALNLLCFIFGIISLLLFTISLSSYRSSVVVALFLKQIRATTIAIAIVRNKIITWRAIENWSHEQNNAKFSKENKSNNFCYCKVKSAIINVEQKEKV